MKKLVILLQIALITLDKSEQELIKKDILGNKYNKIWKFKKFDKILINDRNWIKIPIKGDLCSEQ